MNSNDSYSHHSGHSCLHCSHLVLDFRCSLCCLGFRYSHHSLGFRCFHHFPDFRCPRCSLDSRYSHCSLHFRHCHYPLDCHSLHCPHHLLGVYSGPRKAVWFLHFAWEQSFFAPSGLRLLNLRAPHLAGREVSCVSFLGIYLLVSMARYYYLLFLGA